MSLPGTLTTLRITGTYDSAAGSPQGGAVTFTPSSAVFDAAGDVVITAVPNIATVTNGTLSTLVLPCTDSPGLVPPNWLYTVTVAVPGAQQTFTTYLPHALGGTAGTVDMTALTATPANPAPSGVAYIPSASTVPTVGPSGGGGFLFALGGNLYWLSSGNTLTKLASN